MKPTKKVLRTPVLATNVTSATDPMTMMSVHEMWLESSSVGRLWSGSPIVLTRMPEENAAELVEEHRQAAPIEAELRDDELDRHDDDQHGQEYEDEEQRSEDHGFLSSVSSGTA